MYLFSDPFPLSSDATYSRHRFTFIFVSAFIESSWKSANTTPPITHIYDYDTKSQLSTPIATRRKEASRESSTTCIFRDCTAVAHMSVLPPVNWRSFRHIRRDTHRIDWLPFSHTHHWCWLTYICLCVCATAMCTHTRPKDSSGAGAGNVRVLDESCASCARWSFLWSVDVWRFLRSVRVCILDDSFLVYYLCIVYLSSIA